MTIRVHTHTHTQNMYYLLLSHGNNGYANATQCYVIRILPVLLSTGTVLDVSHVLMSYLRHDEGCLPFDGYGAFCDILSMMATGSVHRPAFLTVVRTCHGCRTPFIIEI
jgi:hypothetical protein